MNKFNTGQIVATPGALQAIPNQELMGALQRHMQGDWGDCCPEDKTSNDDALLQGERLVSTYTSTGGTRFWIITEADRSVTTMLLPEEY